MNKLSMDATTFGKSISLTHGMVCVKNCES